MEKALSYIIALPFATSEIKEFKRKIKSELAVLDNEGRKRVAKQLKVNINLFKDILDDL
jgi:hypothetical protein